MIFGNKESEAATLRITLLLMVFTFFFAGVAISLVSEGRPGVPYYGHVLFLQNKVIENGEVVAVSLAFSDPRNDHIESCNNRIDVFGGLELFRNIPEQNWVLVDYELQSILIADGFAGDADVFKVSACADVATCLDMSEHIKSNAPKQKTEPERPRPKSTVKVNFESVQQRLEIGRKLVKAARCRGCHSLEGVGPKHAPSLTWKRSKYEEGWLENYLRAPFRMRPAMSDLMMLKYTSPNAMPNLKPEELDLVVEYLTNAAIASAPSEQFRRELWQDYDCFSCHTRLYREKPLAFIPTHIPPEIREKAESSQTFKSCLVCHPFGNMRTVEHGPVGSPNVYATDLLFAFEKITLNYLASFLADPAYLEPGTRMPNLALDSQQINDIRELARHVKEAISNGSLKPNRSFYEMEKQVKQ